MNSEFLQQAVDHYWRFANKLNELTSGDNEDYVVGLKRCGLSVREVGYALQHADENLMPMLPLYHDVVTSEPGSFKYPAISDLLLSIHWLSSQVAGLAAERFMNKNYTDGLANKEQAANQTEALIARVDKKVNAYTEYLAKSKIFRSLGNSDSLKCPSFWVDRGLNSVSPTEFRTVMKSDIASCPTKLAYAGVFRDDDIPEFKGRHFPVVIMPDGKWRKDATTGVESCEAYVIDVTRAVVLNLRSALSKHSIDSEAMLWRNYPDEAKRIDTDAHAISLMMAHGGDILENTADLFKYLVSIGIISTDEKWTDIFLDTFEEIKKVVRELTAESNPDAKYEIGSWS